MGVKVRARGDRWGVYVDHRGKRTERIFGAGKIGKRAAEQAAVQIAARLALGDESVLVKAAAPKSIVTFGEIAEAWSPWYQGLYPTRHNTRRNTESVIR